MTFQLGTDEGGFVDKAPLPLTTTEFNALMADAVAGRVTPQFGDRYRVVDGVVANSVFEWNGESFGGFNTQPIVQSFATGKTRASVNGVGDATNMVVESISLPGYLMALNSTLRVVTLWAFTASASIKTLNLKFGGQDVAAPVINGGTLASAKILTDISNVNSYTAQAAYNSTSYGSVGNPVITPGINTRVPITLEFLARWSAAAATETITLVGYSVELVP